jgi:hypothetical protein
MKGQMIDVVFDFVTRNRFITHTARVSPASSAVDERNERHRQATLLDALLYAQPQLAKVLTK